MEQVVDSRLNNRVELLRSFGATAGVTSELLSYNAYSFDRTLLDETLSFPLPDEEFVDEWQMYARKVDAFGFEALADALVQLNFPIRGGISKTENYIAATRKGVGSREMSDATGLSLEHPEQCHIRIHPTWAGRLPVVQTACRADFISLVRAFSHRNEPVDVPESIGACIIAGYNNWSRFHRLREKWLLMNPDSVFSMSCVSDSKHLYQDRFMILSESWYSGASPEKLQLSDAEWRRISLAIRQEHESAHYWTRRVLSSMRNQVIDEIIADYCGLVSAIGHFRGDWLLTFFGLENYPQYREGGRLQNYRGHPPLSDAAFVLLQKLIVASAATLDKFHRHNAEALSGRNGNLLALLTLTNFTLEELASESAVDQLSAELRRHISSSIKLNGVK